MLPDVPGAVLEARRLTRSDGDMLIKYLNHTHKAGLPGVRAILKTPREIPHAQMFWVEPGIYLHLGLKDSLDRCAEINFASAHASGAVLQLKVNVDGVEIARSSRNTMWPILVLVDGIKMRPLIVGLYYGERKPDNFNHFLAPFVDEVDKMKRGDKLVCKLGGFDFELKFRAWIFDLPALASAMGLRGHNHSFGCTICEVKRISSGHSK